MVKSTQRHTQNLFLWLTAAVVTVYTFSSVISAPASVLLNTSGDAGKNYFTFLYQSMYDSGISFSGMNYPYGEHIIFTDAQPPVAWLASTLYHLFNIQPLATLHILLAVSFMLCIVFVYMILSRFGISFIWSLIAAVLISAMSPQQYKLAGHFSLAYACVLPMIFYYMLAWHQEHKLRFALYLFFAGLLFSFIHLYFALMICIWVLLYSLAYFISNRDSLSKRLSHTTIISIAGILPAVIVRLFIFFTDTVQGRPSYPYGARWNRTFLYDIYTSAYSPFSKLITDKLAGGDEGYAYIGIVPLIVLLVTPIIYFITKKKRIDTEPKLAVGIWLFIAVCMLIFGSSIIFVKCFTCLDYASFIKQFRAIGRFSWVYYYLASISAVVLLYRWLTRLSINSKVTSLSFAITALILWVSEALPYTGMTHLRAYYGKENYNRLFNVSKDEWNKLLEANGYVTKDFRALYVIPYYHIGTEKLGLLPRSESLSNASFSTSLQLQLPLMNVMLSRTSWHQAFQSIKLSGGPFTNKEILSGCDQRHIMILHPLRHPLNPDEQYLLSYVVKLGTINGNDVYALSTKELLSVEQKRNQQLKKVYSTISSGDTCITDSCGKWLVAHYDEGKSNNKLFGSGAQMAIDGITKVILNDTISPSYDGEQYEFSAWMFVSDDDYKIGRFRIYLLDDHENIIGDIPVLTQEATDAYGLWLRAAKYFPMPATTHRIKVEVVNIIYPAYLALDELMIRPANATIISKSENNKRVMMVNNHMISTD